MTTLPMHASSPAPDEGCPSTKPAILVVDDDAAVRGLLAVALRQAGFDVTQAGNGVEALQRVAERRFSLMLLDGQMPQLSGRQVLERLRSRPETATLPVILVTAADALLDRLTGLRAGADDYVTKPFAIEEVVARVRAQLRAHDAWRETLAVHARHRSDLARGLDAAGRQTTLEGAGTVLCNALGSQPGVTSAVLIRFTADARAVPIASVGCELWGLRQGDTAPPSTGRYLADRAASGPWLERPRPFLSARAGLRPPALVGGAMVACAPFSENDAGRAHGLLLVGLDEADADAEPNAALASAIDFAAVMAGLLRPRLVERHRIELERMALRSMLRSRSFRPHFQPIVDLRSGDVVGAEALTRFTDGSPPDSRFREAAALGIGVELELATLAAAIDEAASFAPPTAWISLNVSPELMLSSASSLRQMLDLKDRDVVLELSEQEAVTDYDGLSAALKTVGAGVRWSIDDAGSGFASLRHILRLEPDFIKLDRSWVHGVDNDPARQAMIAGLRHFADQTGACLIAEGIERKEECSTLIDLSVELGQGFLLGRPAAIAAA